MSDLMMNSPHKGKRGGEKSFFCLKNVESFSHKMDLLNSQHSAETLNCMYIQESNQKTIYHSNQSNEELLWGASN